MKQRSRALRIAGRVGIIILRALWISTMVLTPLFGFWLASSLAAYHNASQWLSLLVGLLLFPIVPVGWDLFFVWRMRKQPERKRYLTRIDRLVLRTLAINGVFLAVLLGTRAGTAFHALAVRGDWMLDGHHGPIAESIRSRLLGLADRLDRRHQGGGTYGPSDDAPDPDDLPDDPSDVPPPPPPPGDPTATVAPKLDGWPAAATIDPVALAMPDDAKASIASVGAYLAANVPDERARVKAVHDFVIVRLHYDDETYHAIERGDRTQIRPQDAAAVFAAGTGVCAGYAHLAAELGAAAGLEIRYITGYARAPLAETVKLDVDDPWAAGAVASELDGYRHAWNAARVDGRWYLFDATWDDDDEDDDRPYETTYFMTPPALFALDHLPEEAAWQLVATPLTTGDFFRQPALRARVGTLGITLRHPSRSQVSVDGSIDIVIDNPYRAELLVSVRHAGGKSDQGTICDEKPGDRTSTFRCGDLGEGEYEVDLFGAPAGQRTLTHVGSVWVNSR